MRVSIPFKREGLSELKVTEYPRKSLRKVSIPFKREGLSERFGLRGRESRGDCFNSLQTGRSF